MQNYLCIIQVRILSYSTQKILFNLLLVKMAFLTIILIILIFIVSVDIIIYLKVIIELLQYIRDGRK